jgi:micrococcal nuclease
MNLTRTSAAVLLCCLAMAMPMTAIAADIVGTVSRVLDGDTFEIASRKDGIVRIRLCGVHSPERGEPNFRPAKRLLREKIEEREIRCVRVGEGTVCDNRSKPTSRGRVVAQCFIGDDDVAAIMIRARMACDWPTFSGGHYQNVGVKDVCVRTK